MKFWDWRFLDSLTVGSFAMYFYWILEHKFSIYYKCLLVSQMLI